MILFDTLDFAENDYKICFNEDAKQALFEKPNVETSFERRSLNESVHIDYSGALS